MSHIDCTPKSKNSKTPTKKEIEAKRRKAAQWQRDSRAAREDSTRIHFMIDAPCWSVLTRLAAKLGQTEGEFCSRLMALHLKVMPPLKYDLDELTSRWDMELRLPNKDVRTLQRAVGLTPGEALENLILAHTIILGGETRMEIPEEVSARLKAVREMDLDAQEVTLYCVSLLPQVIEEEKTYWFEAFGDRVQYAVFPLDVDGSSGDRREKRKQRRDDYLDRQGIPHRRETVVARAKAEELTTFDLQLNARMERSMNYHINQQIAYARRVHHDGDGESHPRVDADGTSWGQRHEG